MLIIFIDGFSYKYKELLKELKEFDVRYIIPVIPRFGYSVNIHYEMFQGKVPDDLEFFGDLLIKQDTKRESVNYFWYKINDYFRFKIPLLMRIFYKFILNKVFKDLYFLPLQVYHLFEKKGKYLLQEQNFLEIGRRKFKIINFDKKVSFGKRDNLVFKTAKEILLKNPKENLITCFTELDWIIHQNAFNEKFYEKVKQIIDYINILSKIYKDEIIIVSDHGMSEAKKAVNLKLEKIFGIPSFDRVVYFYDSLYLQIWKGKDQALCKDLIEYILEKNIAILLDQNMRRKGNISKKIFGDYIFLLKEGLYFSPNYFGYGKLKAYHGYFPNSENQWGIFLCQEKIKSYKYLETVEVFNFLSEKCN